MGTTGLPPTERDRWAALDARVGALEKATRLQSASIGAGGLRVYDSGGISIADGGGLAISGGGDITIADGGDLTIAGGGTLTMQDGDIAVTGNGQIHVTTPDGILIDGSGSLVVQTPGDIVLKDAAGTVVWKASEDGTIVTHKYAAVDDITLSGDVDPFIDYGGPPSTLTAIAVPAGFRGAHFLCNVSVGQTFAPGDDSSVTGGVVAWVDSDRYEDVNTYLASPIGPVAGIQAFWAGAFDVTDADTLRFGVSASSTWLVPPPPNEGNWHSGVVVIFTRGVPPTVLN